MIIDARNLILGRLATITAKKALQGEDIHIINCENIVEALFRSQRCFPFVSFFQKWKTLTSTSCAARYAIMDAKTATPDRPNT